MKKLFQADPLLQEFKDQGRNYFKQYEINYAVTESQTREARRRDEKARIFGSSCRTSSLITVSYITGLRADTKSHISPG